MSGQQGSKEWMKGVVMEEAAEEKWEEENLSKIKSFCQGIINAMQAKEDGKYWAGCDVYYGEDVKQPIPKNPTSPIFRGVCSVMLHGSGMLTSRIDDYRWQDGEGKIHGCLRVQVRLLLPNGELIEYEEDYFDSEVLDYVEDPVGYVVFQKAKIMLNV